MSDPAVPGLRLAPGALPRVRSAVDDALDRVTASLQTLEADARLPRPWLGDPVSARAAAQYAHAGVDGPEASLASLRAYRDELVRVRDALAATDRGYSGAEDTVAGLFGAGAGAGAGAGR